MSLVPTPTTTLALDEINPASFDFWMRDDVHGALARLRRERPVAWHLLGVPAAARPRLLDLTNRLLAGGDPEYGGTKESLRQAGQELREYGLWLGKSRLADPQDDITTTLVHAELDGDALPPEDLGPFILLLIAAGNETT